MKHPPWDQRIARILVRPLARTRVRPNHVTTVTLCLALLGAGLFAFAAPDWVNWAAGIFVLSRFLDHFDGELARLQGSASPFGYYYDYVVGAVGYAALFSGIGIGLQAGPLGGWALALGAAGAASALISLFSNLAIDRKLFAADSGEAIGYPGFAGFELEDGIYLLAPITWAGFLTPFFVAAGIGAAVYCAWTLWSLMRVGKRA
jgi:phosphatidylglycerophosphate synthase